MKPSIGFVPSVRVATSQEWRQTIGFISRMEWKSVGPDEETFAEQEQRLLAQRELWRRHDDDEM